MRKITREAVERVARLYNNNTDASQALGIAVRSFSRICRRYGIETPYIRKRNQRRAHKATDAKQTPGEGQ